MKHKFARIIPAFLIFGLLLSAVAGAQDRSLSRRQFDAAVAVVDPEERIAALEAFISRNRDAELAVSAHEEIVRSRAEMAERRLADNDIRGAMDLLRRAIAGLPEKTSDRFFESTVARIPFAVSARGYRAEAIELAALLESRFAKEPLRLGAMGEFYLSLEAPVEAIRTLEAAVRLSREDVKLRRPLAAAYRMGLRLDEAEKELQQIAALEASDARAYAELGNLARARGDYGEAARLYRSQLQTDKENAAALEGLALMELAEGRESAAAAALDRIRSLKGADAVDRNLQLQTQLGFYFLAQGKYPQANLAIVQAIAREPRYSWARIAAAELDIAEGRYFEAENHLLAALRNADFPTLRFTLGKLYLAVEDFNGALEQFARAFVIARSGKFAARLGGVLPFEAERLSDLLARERQASIFVAKPPTTDEQFTLAETLVRMEARLQALKPDSSDTTPAPGAARRGGGRIARSSESELEAAANAFINVEGLRRAFRALYVAQRLAQLGQAHDYTQKLVDMVLDLSDAATAPEGSLPEYPNYDREGRIRILRGRALDARGWSHFQQRRNREAIAALQDAVDVYDALPEGRAAMWRLAMIRETVGETREALELYLAAYEPPQDASAVDVKRSVVEVLYRKVHGSLDGFEERLGKSFETAPGVAAAQPGGVSTAAALAAKAPVKLPEAGRGAKLVQARINPRLLRWPFALTAEKAPPPGSVAAGSDTESQAAPGRPRRVPAEESNRRDEPPAAPSRSRRVKTP